MSETPWTTSLRQESLWAQPAPQPPPRAVGASLGMEMTSKQEFLLLALLELGFDLEDARDAVLVGNVGSVDAGVQWITDLRARMNASPAPPDPSMPSGAAANASSSVPSLSTPAPRTSPRTAPPAAPTSPAKLSRGDCELFAAKANAERAAQAKRSQRDAAALLRRQIEDDRRAVAERAAMTRPGPAPAAAAAPAPKPAAAAGPKPLKIRLRAPDGKLATFEADVVADPTIQNLIAFICLQWPRVAAHRDTIELVQPFPRRVWTVSDGATKCRDVGLHGAVLNVTIPAPPPPPPAPQPDQAEVEEEAEEEEEEHVELDPVVFDVPMPLVGPEDDAAAPGFPTADGEDENEQLSDQGEPEFGDDDDMDVDEPPGAAMGPGHVLDQAPRSWADRSTQDLPPLRVSPAKPDQADTQLQPVPRLVDQIARHVVHSIRDPRASAEIFVPFQTAPPNLVDLLVRQYLALADAPVSKDMVPPGHELAVLRIGLLPVSTLTLDAPGPAATLHTVETLAFRSAILPVTLTHLALRGLHATGDRLIRAVAGFRNLHHLDLTGTIGLTDQASATAWADALAHWMDLTELRLSGTAIGPVMLDTLVATLAPRNSLQVLALDNCPNLANHQGAFPTISILGESLRELSLVGTRLAAFMPKLALAPMPNLERLLLDGTDLRTRDIRAVLDAANGAPVTALSLPRGVAIADCMLSRFPMITHLHYDHTMNANVLPHLLPLPLAEITVAVQDLAHVPADFGATPLAWHLRRVHLTDRRSDPAPASGTVAFLTACHGLVAIDVARASPRCGLTDTDLAQLARSVSALVIADLDLANSPRITDAGIRTILASFPSIERIRVDSTGITAQGVLALVKDVPAGVKLVSARDVVVGVGVADVATRVLGMRGIRGAVTPRKVPVEEVAGVEMEDKWVLEELERMEMELVMVEKGVVV